jgi:hypothetical protein
MSLYDFEYCYHILLFGGGLTLCVSLSV